MVYIFHAEWAEWAWSLSLSCKKVWPVLLPYILNPILRGYERETFDIVKSVSPKMFISDVSNFGLILERSPQSSPAAYFWILICWKFAQVLKNSWNVKLENVNSWSRPEFNLVSIPGYSCCPVYWLFLAHCYYHQGRQWCFTVFRIKVTIF